MQSNLKYEFDKASITYDSQRKALIPCFDDFYRIAVDNLNLQTSSPEILDLGSGTGIFSGFILERYPNAKITLIDISDKMLEVARQRLAEQQANVKTVCQDITRFTIDRKYDAVISSLAIHHLTDSQKEKLYRDIYYGLKDEGVFINADQVLAPTPYMEGIYNARWKQKVESSGLAPDEILAAYKRVALDSRTPLAIQLRWLRETGFRHVDNLYKYYDFVVIWAMK